MHLQLVDHMHPPHFPCNYRFHHFLFLLFNFIAIAPLKHTYGLSFYDLSRYNIIHRILFFFSSKCPYFYYVDFKYYIVKYQCKVSKRYLLRIITTQHFFNFKLQKWIHLCFVSIYSFKGMIFYLPYFYSFIRVCSLLSDFTIVVLVFAIFQNLTPQISALSF